MKRPVKRLLVQNLKSRRSYRLLPKVILGRKEVQLLIQIQIKENAIPIVINSLRIKEVSG
jgi:hypothetical protein